MNKLKIKHTQGAWMILWLSEGWHRTGTQPHAVYAGEHDAAAINMLVKVLLTMLVNDDADAGILTEKGDSHSHWR